MNIADPRVGPPVVCQTEDLREAPLLVSRDVGSRSDGIPPRK